MRKSIALICMSFLLSCVSGNIQEIRETAKNHSSFVAKENYQSVYKRVFTCVTERYSSGGLLGSGQDVVGNLYSDLGEAEIYYRLKTLVGIHILLSVDLKKLDDENTQIDIRNPVEKYNGHREKIKQFVLKESDKCA